MPVNYAVFAILKILSMYREKNVVKNFLYNCANYVFSDIFKLYMKARYLNSRSCGSRRKLYKKAAELHFSRVYFMLLLLLTYLVQSTAVLLADDPTIIALKNEAKSDNMMYSSSISSNSSNSNNRSANNPSNLVVSSNGYLDKLDNLERSVAAVLIKVAYGTTSTTKRSIPDTSYVASLTTVATPLLTTLRYPDKTSHQQQQQQLNIHHRNYELDLERDHALPTSAPNADILKSNSNPTYPNPNRHHSHERERHRHFYNSTPIPSLPNLLKSGNGQMPTVPMYPGDIPSYSPPSRAFFTPPLPPEYQNPFADKPTLRGTNNEGVITNINRRPIPPPSLMPGHERIPFRPPDLAASITFGNNVSVISTDSKKDLTTTDSTSLAETERKKALNTPSRINDAVATVHNKLSELHSNTNQHEQSSVNEDSKRQEVLPSIRRILSGSNGKKGDIPEVLLKQVTNRPLVNFHQPPSSPVVIIDQTAQRNEHNDNGDNQNINKIKQSTQIYDNFGVENPNVIGKGMLVTKPTARDVISEGKTGSVSSNPVQATPTAAAGGGMASSSSSYVTPSSSINIKTISTFGSNDLTSDSSTGSAAAAAAGAEHTTWVIAWNIHVYLSVILFTILAVYSLYKILTYNKLTHLFSQSYFLCIHLILIIICSTRIFYLCYDAYNTHTSFHIFVNELLLNLPATFLTVSFSVLILFLFLKSLNHKNNRYSALIRPLTVVVGCGVHVVLCITLHYVESYTLQNQQMYYQQQQYYRKHQQQQLLQAHYVTLSPAAGLATSPPPPRVLTLICQIIYIFICLSLGLLYLYLYRVLKRILRSKSQNYIHGYQNLSYAIHITIATALLFVLLAVLQIFGAICISTARPIVTQVTFEIDWLQWGYQFSLRLIEIAIITLISWVTGLKTSSNSGANTSVTINGAIRGTMGPNSVAFGSGIPSSSVGPREKHSSGAHHTNVANFFLPCTSSSSQEQFDTDYPAICNANTNLHTYTMRTGKLIYDDSYALNTLGPGSQGNHSQINSRNCADYQLQQPTYQHPYDTGSVNHNIAEYSAQDTASNHRYHQLQHSQQPFQDYLTDVTTDHYENPNFDLHVSSSGGALKSQNNVVQKFTKTSTSSTATVLSSGGSGSSAASQQQMLLLQSDSCYSEPLQENSSYEFNNFERPLYGEDSSVNQSNQANSIQCWADKTIHNKSCDKKAHNILDRGAFENPERRSSNSTNSCVSNGGVNRYTECNSFDRGYYNSIRKSGTLNSIANQNNRIINPGSGTATQRTTGLQTVNLTGRQQSHLRCSRNNGHNTTTGTPQDLLYGRETTTNKQHHQFQHINHNSDEEEDDMISANNVECTNLINNEDSSCITTNSNNSGVTAAVRDGIHKIVDQSPCKESQGTIVGSLNVRTQLSKHSHGTHIQSNPIAIHAHSNNSNKFQTPQGDTISPVSDESSPVNSGASSTASESMLVTEQGFLRFRALDDINNAQGIGIHNTSIRKQVGRGTISSTLNCNPSSNSGINC